MHINYFKTFVLLVAIVILSATASIADDQKTSDSPVAVVNGVPISRESFDRRFDVYRQTNNMPSSCQGLSLSNEGVVGQQPTTSGSCQSPPPEKIAAMRSHFLDIMINNELLIQESKRQNIVIPETEIDAFLNGLKSQYASEADFHQYLDEIHLTEQEIRKEIQHEMAARKLIYEKVEKNITVTPEECKKFFEDNRDSFAEPEQVRVSHILVAVPKAASEEEKAAARIKIEKIQDRIKNGEDFAAVAKQTSDCPTGANGGDLGFISRGQVNDGALEDTAFTMKPNQITIIWTHLGYDLLKVTDHKDRKEHSFEEVKGEVNTQEIQAKTDQAMEKYINELRSAAKIKKLI